MKSYFILFILVFFIIGCDDREKRSRDSEAFPIENSSIGEDNFGEENNRGENDADNTNNIDLDEENPAISGNAANNSLEGRFRKINTEGGTGPCDCTCLEVSYTSHSELCIVPDKAYILAKFVETGANEADVFLVDTARVEEMEREIPWGEFDRNAPIASVRLEPDGTMSLDWKGFAIDGELAVDYAIFGKKTLEGAYQKE